MMQRCFNFGFGAFTRQLCSILFLCNWVSAQIAQSNKSSHTVFDAYFSPSASFGSYTPCTYPTPPDFEFQRRCLISERAYEKYNMCNLDGAVSNTELDGIVSQLNEMFYDKRGRCICETSANPTTTMTRSTLPFEETFRTRPPRKFNNTTYKKLDEDAGLLEEGSPSPEVNQLCWYKIAFAFLHHLPMPTMRLPNQIQYQELCNSSLTNGFAQPPKDGRKSWTPNMARAYGMKFAQVLRERWQLGQCGEDILLLVVVHRPDSLDETEENKTGPIIFASWGETVQERTAHVTIEEEWSLLFLMNQYNKLMADQDKTKLKYYLSALLGEYFKALSLADQTNSKPAKIKNFDYEDAAKLRSKQHVPDWALGAFGGCALLLIVMALGYCLVKSRVRRGMSRAKPGADGSRRWKAGFVGERGAPMPKPKRKRRTKLFPMKSLKLGAAVGRPQPEQARRGYGAVSRF